MRYVIPRLANSHLNQGASAAAAQSIPPQVILDQPDFRRFNLLQFERFFGGVNYPIDALLSVGAGGSTWRDGRISYRIPTGPNPAIFSIGLVAQQTIPIPAIIGQPELGRYSNLQNSRYYPNQGPIPQVHQGASVQETRPIPGISQPELSYYKPDFRKFNTTGPTIQFTGATNLSTDPIPSVSQPLFNRYFRTSTYSDIAVQTYQQVIATPQTYEFPVSQPNLAYFIRKSQLEQIKQLDQVRGQDFVSTVNQPELIRFNQQQEIRKYQTLVPRLEGATNQQIYAFPVNQPEFRYYRLQFNRYNLSAIPQVSGPPSYQLYDFKPNQPELRRFGTIQYQRFQPGSNLLADPAFPVITPSLEYYYRRYLDDPDTPIITSNQPTVDISSETDFTVYLRRYLDDPHGGPSKPSYEFQVSQPNLNYYNKNRYQFLGSISQLFGAVAAKSDIFQLSQPDNRYWVRRNTNYAEIPPRPEIYWRQTYEFLVSQPDFTRYRYRQYQDVSPRFENLVLAPVETWQRETYHPIQPERRHFNIASQRQQPPVTQQFLGLPNPQLYEFKLSQPEMSYYRRIQQVPVIIRPHEAAPAAQTQSYIFSPDQPTSRQWIVLQRNRYVVDNPKRIDDGAIIQQSYIFQPNQPNFSYYRRITRNILDQPLTTQIVSHFMWISPTQAPNGIITQFTFTQQPVWCSFNGLNQFPGVGYTITYVNPNWVVTFIDVNLNVITPQSGDDIRAEVL